MRPFASRALPIAVTLSNKHHMRSLRSLACSDCEAVDERGDFNSKCCNRSVSLVSKLVTRGAPARSQSTPRSQLVARKTSHCPCIATMEVV